MFLCGVDNRSRPTRLPTCLHCKRVICVGSRHSGGKGTGPEDALGSDVQSNVSSSEKVFLHIDGGGSFIPHQAVTFWVDGESGFEVCGGRDQDVGPDDVYHENVSMRRTLYCDYVG
jgi:hypothetical protein